MKFYKLVLIGIGLIFLTIAAFWVIGIVAALLPYIFFGGIVLLVGVVGYKIFSKRETKQISGKMPIDEFQLNKADKTLEEYKRKYLPK